MKSITYAFAPLLAGLLAACSSAPTAADPQEPSVSEQDISRRLAVRLARTDLVSDQPGMAGTTDANLKNAWGIAFNPAGPAWVSNAGSSTTTVYDATGKLLLTVAVPAAATDTEGSSPTGQVFNASTGFAGDKFILANEHGTLIGWQPTGGAKTRADRTSAGSVYKGLAIVGAKIFATDFHNGAIDVFDASYTKVPTAGFVDPTIPAGYAPFNIQELGGKLYVTYAQQDADKHDDQQGAGKGFVSVFEASGTFIGRIASRGSLNAPWGLALAPASLGPKVVGKLLVGNFGDGGVQAFDVSFATTDGDGDGDNDGFGYGSPAAAKTTVHASYLGSLLGANGQKLAIDGLWALAVSPQGQLFFSAGPGGEAHGAFGKLSLATSP
jgi:uncharacterized protein (TIGR03118 family)